MLKVRIYNESIILNAGHSLIMSHKPEKIKMDQVNDKLEQAPQEVSSFGLFDRSTPNYTTYYPEVTPEDLSPENSEFIEPIFRMLSNVTVHAPFNPIFFPSDVLKKSMYKMVGQTINIDHEMAVGNAIGTVKSVQWQNAYTANGVKVPAGFNAVLKIDGKSNPRIARGIMMDPPSIHANSVTVKFAWKPSHPKLTEDEFFNQLGTFDKNGKLIQKIATEIKAYHETSLVSHGADPFAQKVDENGKIVLPKYASDRYPLSDQSMAFYSWDWKNLEVGDIDEVIINTSSESLHINNNNQQNSENMEELLKFLETFFGLEADSLTEENVQEKLGEIDFAALKAKADQADAPVVVLDLEGVEAIENEVTTLREFKDGVPENLEAQIALATVGQTAIDQLRAETKRLYGLTIEGGKEDVNILAVIEGADFKTLQSLHNQYDEAVENDLQLTCNECGSHEFTRASADPGQQGDDKTPKSREEVIDKFTSSDNAKLPKFMQPEKKAD